MAYCYSLWLGKFFKWITDLGLTRNRKEVETGLDILHLNRGRTQFPANVSFFLPSVSFSSSFSFLTSLATSAPTSHIIHLLEVLLDWFRIPLLMAADVPVPFLHLFSCFFHRCHFFAFPRYHFIPSSFSFHWYQFPSFSLLFPGATSLQSLFSRCHFFTLSLFLRCHFFTFRLPFPCATSTLSLLFSYPFFTFFPRCYVFAFLALFQVPPFLLLFLLSLLIPLAISIRVSTCTRDRQLVTSQLVSSRYSIALRCRLLSIFIVESLFIPPWHRHLHSKTFIDAFSHLFKKVFPSVSPSVRPTQTSWISENGPSLSKTASGTRKYAI